MDRIIIVANQLPLKAKSRPDNKGWSFTWDDDSLLFRLKDGFADDMEVLYVGSLNVDVDGIEQDDVAQVLLERFRCVPTFLPPSLMEKFYIGFGKKQLWPLFHYMLPILVDHGGRFDRSVWEAYVSANRLFSQIQLSSSELGSAVIAADASETQSIILKALKQVIQLDAENLDSQCYLDLSGRPHLNYNLQIPTEQVGTYDTQQPEFYSSTSDIVSSVF